MEPKLTYDLYSRAAEVLMMPEPSEKCEAVAELYSQWLAGRIDRGTAAVGEDGLQEPGRPAKPDLVSPRNLPKRSLYTTEGRLVFMHAIAHIEFNAINLACDAVYRFRDLPAEYYGDWLSVAADEARHFMLLSGYLNENGCAYGDYPAHGGLWDMALKTRHDVLARMALVPRVLEARGLDVTPAMIGKLKAAGDSTAAGILEVIYREEIQHVEAGSRWFRYLCERRGLEPQRTFFELVEAYLAGELRGPFNLEAREQAGFTKAELAELTANECN